jgi:hypothetical protein
VSRSTRGADYLIEFDLQCLGVPVLRILNKEDHQESNDRCTGVNDELPCIAEVK